MSKVISGTKKDFLRIIGELAPDLQLELIDCGLESMYPTDPDFVFVFSGDDADVERMFRLGLERGLDFHREFPWNVAQNQGGELVAEPMYPDAAPAFFIQIGYWDNGAPKMYFERYCADEADARAKLVEFAAVDKFGATDQFAGYLFRGSEQIAIMHMYGAGRYEFEESQ